MTRDELIADLRERINPAYADQRGTESYERKQCADALEAADKRIAEERETYDRMLEEGAEKLHEAERRLAVAREFIKDTQTEYKEGTIGYIDCEKVLAQIGGDGAG